MDQEKIRERIRQLLGRTVDRGCSEAEAMEAAAKAAELMAAHGLAAGDIAFLELGAKMRTQGRTPRDTLWGTISFCTNTAAMLANDRSGVRLMYLGREPGPQIAVYLHEVCDRAVDKEIATFKASTFYKRRRSITTRRAAVADFTDGLVARLRTRLLKLFEQTIDEGDVARAEAKAEQSRRYPNLQSLKRPERERRYDEAAAAGYGAGSKVQLSHGVGGPQGAPLQIGRA